jgi:hypothetical protein
MVTHDQEEAQSLSDRIVLMNQGRIEQVGTPWQIYNQPATAFVADFIGTGNLHAGVATAGGVRVDAFAGRWCPATCGATARPGAARAAAARGHGAVGHAHRAAFAAGHGAPGRAPGGRGARTPAGRCRRAPSTRWVADVARRPMPASPSPWASRWIGVHADDVKVFT